MGSKINRWMVLPMAIAALSFPACSSPGHSAEAGAAIGAGVGATAGLLADPGDGGGHRIRNVLIGTGVGGVLGAGAGLLIGNNTEAEKQAAQLRGQGVALFREEVAKGMSQAAEQMKQANLDTNVILFSMWTEAIKNFAELGKGNVIFLDGSSEGMEKTMRQIMAMQQMEKH